MPEVPIDVIIGLDGGSTTTKVIILKNNDLSIVAEICVYTNGQPLAAAQSIFRQARENLGDKINIRGVSYTGSSGAFYHKLFTDFKKEPEKICIDIIKDEITCHAVGVKHFNEKVDTIFELGGQDAKFTLFNPDGTVKKSKMNLSCMAGTGQTMQNMVEMIGLDIKNSFHEYALRAKRTPIIDETCGVFTEAGIAKLIALDFPKEEIAAAIAYGFMGGYINKFVGKEKFGKFASAQGGPFNGIACLTALALHTGMEIHAFPHRQLFGAFGAALCLKDEFEILQKKGEAFASKFRGFKISEMKFEKITGNCSEVIEDSCGLRDCKLQAYIIDNDRVLTGGLCPKGNTESAKGKAPDYVSIYKTILNKRLAEFTVDIDKKTNKERVLIPRTLTFLNEKGIFYAVLFRNLGFEVAVSPESDNEISNLGTLNSHSEMCFPVKLAHGHTAFLKKHFRPGKDKFFLVNAVGAGKDKRRFCPYVSGVGFLIKESLGLSNKDCLLPMLYFDNKKYNTAEYIYNDLNRVFKNRFNKNQVIKSVKKAEQEQEKFLNEIYEMGEKFMRQLENRGEKIFFGTGRGYTLIDDKANSKIHELFSNYGMHFIPMLFLRDSKIKIDNISENIFWVQGRKIIKNTVRAATNKNVFVVRETNFNCGPDSMLLYHEEEILNKAEKPNLVLQTDGHNSNAQFGTRILANFEVVKKCDPPDMTVDDFTKEIRRIDLEDRLIGFPCMGDSSNAVEYSFRSLGFRTESIPTFTSESRELAKKLVNSNCCRPLSFQVGDIIAWLKSKTKDGIPPEKLAIFEPDSKGPCRFGQYHVLLRKFFNENGFKAVSVINPDSNKDYSNYPLPKWKIVKLVLNIYKGFVAGEILLSMLLRTRPYEKEKGAAEKVYEEQKSNLNELVAANSSVSKIRSFLSKSMPLFEAAMDKAVERKPIVSVNGEIFMRWHPAANQNSIKLLEKYGLEVVLSGVSQWIDYVNKSMAPLYFKQSDWYRYFTAQAKRRVLDSIKKRLYEPVNVFLAGRKEHAPEVLYSAAHDALLFDKLIEGESIMSIGEAYLFSKGDLNDISGIYHIAPFGCMHETAASSQIQSIIQKTKRSSKTPAERIIPFMDAVFGDSELPNLEAEIAAFAEMCKQRKKLK